MKLRIAFLSLAALLGVASTAAAQQGADFWSTPAIKGIGPVHAWPEATLKPDAATTYKAIFDITKAGKDTDVNAGLSHVARVINSFAAAGVPLDHLHFALVIHGPATPAALDAKTFEAKFHHPNPNVDVLEKLKKAGVRLLVCGNALGDWHYTPADVNPNFEVAWSALSTLIILQDQGYAVLAM
ncbi:MAG TPA: DsrE family protein [Gemmatimonadales bacterium]|nr:DsrE family protein [Gemmatimonadales bacterium]